jgi:hypothetical protein
MRAHHRFMLVQHLAHIDFLEDQVAAFDLQLATLEREIGTAPRPEPVKRKRAQRLQRQLEQLGDTAHLERAGATD